MGAIREWFDIQLHGVLFPMLAARYPEQVLPSPSSRTRTLNPHPDTHPKQNLILALTPTLCRSDLPLS